jgi:cell division septum initiation protein DivIVA
MTSEAPTDVLPFLADPGRGFDVAMRGYDRAQVDGYLYTLDDQLRGAAAERDSALSRSADLAAQLASAFAQLESARRQLATATARVTEDNIDDAVREVLTRARREATELTTAAAAEAAAIRGGAAESAARTRATAEAEAADIVATATERHAQADEMFRQRLAEAERHRTEVETGLVTRYEQVRAQESELTATAQAERERLDAESAVARAGVEEDFELVLRERRTTELAESARIVADAKAQADRLVADAEQRVRELSAQRDSMHGRLRELHGELGSTLDAHAG